MTRFRVVKAPGKLGRLGSYAVLSDRPGPSWASVGACTGGPRRVTRLHG